MNVECRKGVILSLSRGRETGAKRGTAQEPSRSNERLMNERKDRQRRSRSEGKEEQIEEGEEDNKPNWRISLMIISRSWPRNRRRRFNFNFSLSINLQLPRKGFALLPRYSQPRPPVARNAGHEWLPLRL